MPDCNKAFMDAALPNNYITCSTINSRGYLLIVDILYIREIRVGGGVSVEYFSAVTVD